MWRKKRGLTWKLAPVLNVGIFFGNDPLANYQFHHPSKPQQPIQQPYVKRTSKSKSQKVLGWWTSHGRIQWTMWNPGSIEQNPNGLHVSLAWGVQPGKSCFSPSNLWVAGSSFPCNQWYKKNPGFSLHGAMKVAKVDIWMFPKSYTPNSSKRFGDVQKKL
jgi:hypothetical protein